MKCDDCIYLGIVFEHLRGYDGCEKWVQCKYPLPFHYSEKAVPYIEHQCKTYTPNKAIRRTKTEGNFK